MAAPHSSSLQRMLQTAVQTVQWTYSLFWQLCPQQGVLTWADGYYNGAIKTRKTVQPLEANAEEATLQRSQQLRELYDSLSAGEANQTTRRPSAALSPEDLTESEWFYLMCMAFSYPPGNGLPGKAFAKRQHIWLTGASETDSKVFFRAILAKSARIQTVVCIALLDGVVELGTTEKVEEDVGIVETIKSFFIDNQHLPLPPKPASSEHSTSNPTTSSELPCLHSSTLPSTLTHINSPSLTNQMEDEDEDEEEEEEAELDLESDAGHNDIMLGPKNSHNLPQIETASLAAAEASELMQLDMSEDIIRLGSSDDASNNMDPDFHLLAASHTAKSTHRWGDSQDLKDKSLQPPLISETSPALEELTQEGINYCQTVSTILQHQSSRWSDSSTPGDVMYSLNSAFTKWCNTTSTASINSYIDQITASSSSQWLLKSILFTVPLFHAKSSIEAGPKDGRASHFRKPTPQEELSGNHVLAERRRREKLNERFIILRSLVPFVTKLDKASILSDTIEYVKQLRNKIQDLEARTRQMEAELLRSTTVGDSGKNVKEQESGFVMAAKMQTAVKKRKMRIVEGGGGCGKAEAVVALLHEEAVQVVVEVSIIENDALVELQCPHREGLLLDVMQMLRELRVEITMVQSSLNNGLIVAELRAKVKENAKGKKARITEVKRAMHRIISHH